MLVKPELEVGKDGCYCPGWKWLVLPVCKTGIGMNASKSEIDAGMIPHKDYFPGDIIEDYYFSPDCCFIKAGYVELYTGNSSRLGKYRDIDELWSYE
jgi:hypothetical protein